MDNFERCQQFVSAAEGKDNFDDINGKPVLKPKNKKDRGGPTRYGITWGTLSRAYSQGIVNHSDITKLTRQEANEIYRENYWKPSRADKMTWGLCLVHYDCAVNSGVGGAAKMLQRSLNDLAGSEVARVDGVIGPASLTAIGRVDADALTRKYLEIREAFYHALVARDPGQSGFLAGWLRRVADLRKEVGVDG